MAPHRFNAILNEIDRDAVVLQLESSAEPMYESALMKTAFSGERLTVSEPLKMFQYHFVLFHYLFELQKYYVNQGKYLHIHFMRIQLVDYPIEGCCRFYEKDFGRFCGVNTDDYYCDRHRKVIGHAELDVLSERYFYLDTANFESLNEETAEAFISGAWEVLARFESYRESFNILGLRETATVDQIRKRFYQLAKETHPDINGNDPQSFITINNAYQFLIKVIPMVPENMNK